MTLILVAASREFMVQASDRRISSALHIVSEEETKSMYLQMPNAQYAIAYTGIARVGTRPTNQVIADLLVDRVIARARWDHNALIHEFRAALTQLFRSAQVTRYRAEDRRLSVILTGYQWHGERWTGPVQALLTNFQDWGVDDSPIAWNEFTTRFMWIPEHTPPSRASIVQKLGRWDLVSADEGEQMRSWLAPGRPPRAARDQMVAFIRSRSKPATGVGGQCNTLIIRPGQQPEWSYWTEHVSGVTYSGDQILVNDRFEITAVRGFTMSSDDAPVAVPKVGRRKRCPCGSGKRYGVCHGRELSGPLF